MIKNAEKLEGLQPEFKLYVIEFARFLEVNYDMDLIITSGFRTYEENERVGGARNSAHLKGLAVDVYVVGGKERFYIVDAAMRFGFKRIGVGYRHVHLDMDLSKPFPTVFPDPRG